MDLPKAKQILASLTEGKQTPIFVTNETIAATRRSEKFYFVGSGMRLHGRQIMLANFYRTLSAENLRQAARLPRKRAATCNEGNPRTFCALPT